MSLFDFFVSFSNKFNSKSNSKQRYNLENLSASMKISTNNNFAPITISIDRELNIDSALSVLEKVEPKLTRVTNY